MLAQTHYSAVYLLGSKGSKVYPGAAAQIMSVFKLGKPMVVYCRHPGLST